MAEDTVVNGRKRPHPHDGPQQEDQKRIRSNHGSPAPSSNPGGSGVSDMAKAIAEAKARAAAAASRRGGTGANGLSQHALSPAPPPAGRPMSKIEEMRARVAALTGKSTAAPAQSASPPPPSGLADDGYSRARGGLSAALHPSLLDSNKDTTAKSSSQSKFSGSSQGKTGNKSQSKGKRQLDLSGPNLDEFQNQNPYFDASLGGITATLKSRAPKSLHFNEKGKYIAQAASMRRLEALEAMRKRIAASSKKALLEEDVAEKKFVIDPPPEIEWWDEGLVGHPEKGYAEIDLPGGLKLENEDSVITRLVQHPALIQPPGDRLMPAPKPMFLTTKEQRKIRRQRRMADLKETQAKIRLGLMEPPPDKVKLGNLMRVLGEEAVKDPTAVETRVNRQIAERKQKHLQANEERKLSKEERHQKLDEKKAGDVAKGVFLTVYRIDNLANGRHRFKISKNVEQLGGTGLVIFSPKFCLVLTEFGAHGTRQYKKLMLNRIDWTENSPSQVREGNKAAKQAFLEAEDEMGELKDLQGNKCQLVFEGEEKDRKFRKWASRVCETDKEAMDALKRTDMQNFWTLAKSLNT